MPQDRVQRGEYKFRVQLPVGAGGRVYRNEYELGLRDRLRILASETETASPAVAKDQFGKSRLVDRQFAQFKLRKPNRV